MPLVGFEVWSNISNVSPSTIIMGTAHSDETSVLEWVHCDVLERIYCPLTDSMPRPAPSLEGL
jgi:hypothetical protein